MTALHDAYAEDMRLYEPFQPAQEAYAANPIAPPDPPSMVMTAQGPQHMLSAPVTATVNLDPITVVMVESADRTDAYAVELEVTLKREWAGELEATTFARSTRWEADATPVPPEAPKAPETPAEA